MTPRATPVKADWGPQTVGSGGPGLTLSLGVCLTLGDTGSGQREEIGRDDGSPDVGVERRVAFPRATGLLLVLATVGFVVLSSLVDLLAFWGFWVSFRYIKTAETKTRGLF